MSTPDPTSAVPPVSVGDVPTVLPTSIGDAVTAGDVTDVTAPTVMQAVPGFEILGELGRGMGVEPRCGPEDGAGGDACGGVSRWGLLGRRTDDCRSARG